MYVTATAVVNYRDLRGYYVTPKYLFCLQKNCLMRRVNTRIRLTTLKHGRKRLSFNTQRKRVKKNDKLQILNWIYN